MMSDAVRTMYIVGFDAKGTMHRPLTLRPDQTLIEARNTMMKYDISRIVISKKDQALGIITEKDIGRFIYQQAPSARMDEVRLDEVMSKDLVTVEPDTDLRRCAKMMLDRKISSLLVVDKTDLKGILTKSDLSAAYVEYFSLKHMVGDFMSKKVFVVAPDEPIHSAILLMTGNEISRVVVSKNNRPIGIVTTKNLLPLGAYFSSDAGARSSGKERPFIPSGIKARLLVSDIMTANPISAEVDSDLADSAYVMLRNRISGMPVTDSKGELVGIVTKTDVLKAMASAAV